MSAGCAYLANAEGLAVETIAVAVKSVESVRFRTFNRGNTGATELWVVNLRPPAAGTMPLPVVVKRGRGRQTQHQQQPQHQQQQQQQVGEKRKLTKHVPQKNKRPRQVADGGAPSRADDVVTSWEDAAQWGELVSEGGDKQVLIGAMCPVMVGGAVVCTVSYGDPSGKEAQVAVDGCEALGMSAGRAYLANAEGLAVKTIAVAVKSVESVRFRTFNRGNTGATELWVVNLRPPAAGTMPLPVVVKRGRGAKR
jgi:hypothetical protein